MTLLKVVIKPEDNMISVWNNGKGIPCVIHKEHGVYVAELIFGHLLTSSNYDDAQKKVTGGRNGYGAKLTNIFSKKFVVDASDEKNGKLFHQEYTENMSQKSEPVISKYRGKDYTCITFYPDLQRFGMEKLDEDMVSLMMKRVYDVAGVTPESVEVHLNEQKLSVRSFEQYVDYYLKNAKKQFAKVGDENESGEEAEDLPKIFERINDRWEVCVSMSDGQFQQISFVNGICTIKGGTHVNAVTDQVVEVLASHILKKHKLDLKSHQIKANLWVFVNSLIENPTFDSQSKETLTLKPTAFGSDYTLSEGFIKKVLTCGVVETLVAVAQAKDKANLAKQLKGRKRGRLFGIEKLEDANFAGTKRSEECVLIVTEGDSAKGLAMDGIEVVGRDKFGVFPLRGKMLNVRDAKSSQVRENKEINSLIQILGLQVGTTYSDLKSLRYGGLMIMADQDVDGSHIKGLVINFFQSFWPSLFMHESFLTQFITPIIKATKGKEVHQFFTIPEYEGWAKDRNLSGYKIKYYKGLGTSTNQEAKEYFKNISRHRLTFSYQDHEDDDAIVMAFGKKCAEQRKDWINSYEEGTYIDYNQHNIRYKDFVNRELILFSMYDNLRSIPSMCDGFKPGQRKILFACFKRNLRGEIKVAQLSGYVSEHSAYHHGEASLASTIVGMAQNFVGSNNINLLLPIGQFGTRHMGGKEAASPRYIYTSLSKLARVIFRQEDDALMKYQIEEGQKIEPEWYLPIVPMILVNGAEGIGTGWRSSLPNYNPREIVANLRRKMDGGEFEHMCPWFKNYTGKILPDDSKREHGFMCYGSYEVKDEETVQVTELPIRKWTRDYKTFLEEHFEGAAKEKEKMDKKEGKDTKRGKDGKKRGKRDRNGAPKPKKTKRAKEEKEGEGKSVKKREPVLQVDDIREYHIGNKVDFQVKVKKESLAKIVKDDAMVREFKLSASIPTTQFVCFGHDNKLKRYVDELEIMEEFYTLRLLFYDKRKMHMLSTLKRDLNIIDNKVRFILGVIDETIVVKRQKRKVIVVMLFKKGFTPYSKFTIGDEQDKLAEKLLVIQAEQAEAENAEEEENEKEKEKEEGKENAGEAKGRKKTDDTGLPVPTKEYDYLLSMPMWSLTYERVEQLLAQKKEKEDQIAELDKLSAKDIWKRDLDEFIKALDDVENAEALQLIKDMEAAPSAKDAGGKKPRRRAKKEGAPPNKRGKRKGKTKENKTAEGKSSEPKQEENALTKFLAVKPQSSQPAAAHTQTSKDEITEGKRVKFDAAAESKPEAALSESAAKPSTSILATFSASSSSSEVSEEDDD